MKEGWEVKAWSDVLDIRSGRNQKQVICDDGKFPIIGSAGKVMGYAKEYLCEANTTIIGRKGTIDKPLFIKTNFWNVDTAFGLIASELLNNRFLHYFCLSYDFQKHNKGTTLPSLVKKDLVKIEIPVPPLAEQEAIVEVLDKAFAAIDQAKANIEQNIANAKELFQSKLNQIFSKKGEGWVERTLSKVCIILNGYAFKSKEAISDSGTQLLRMGNLYQNVLDLKRNPVFYPDEYSAKHAQFLLEEGDLIMSLTGTVDKTDYGYTVKVPKTEVKLLLNQRIMKISIIDSSSLNKDYLESYLLSPPFLKKLYASASGTRQANLSSRTILTFPIIFPKSLHDQVKMVNTLHSIRNTRDRLVESYQTKLTSLEELKKSILKKAFAGELT